MNLFQVVFTVLTPLPGTELYEENYDRFPMRNYDFFDHVHSILPTKLHRKEFYRFKGKGSHSGEIMVLESSADVSPDVHNPSYLLEFSHV